MGYAGLNRRRARIRAVADPYRWTRWAAPGGAGYGLVGWVAIVAGLGVAGLVFHIVSRWWLVELGEGIR